ncbi:MAG: Cof-type HAD-IIB family hydrolase [Erysipelotrichales bacterium]|nr:Cof-type HAD-IIB family hydrolase [Erysipelotrichales bacterium]
MEIRLVLFDIDNTLYSHKTHGIPASAKEAFRELKKRGVATCISTGRGFTVIQPEIKDLHADYYIDANGQEVRNERHEIIEEHFVPIDVIERLTKYCREHGFAVVWKFSDGEWLYTSKKEFYENYKRSAELGFPGLNFDNDRKHLAAGCIGGVVLAPDYKYMILEKEFPEMELLPFNDENTDMVLRGVSKKTGMKTLCDYIGIRPENCMAFGDGKNDAEMLRYAGIGVAMKVSAKEAIEAADYVTDDIDENGVWNALRHFGVIE